MPRQLIGLLAVALSVSLATPAAGASPRVLRFRGAVVLEDGSPAPANTVIARFCNGASQAITRLEPNGTFAFDIGGPMTGTVPDVSYPWSDRQIRVNTASGGDWTSTATGSWASSLPSMIGCELWAQMPGFRSAAVPLYGYASHETNIELGVLVLHKLTEVQGAAVSVNSAQAPRAARNAFENGLKSARKGKWNKAETQLRRAVEEYPDYAVAWEALGEVLEAQQRPAEAREAYNNAIHADASYLGPYMHSAVLDSREDNWQAMEEVAGQVIRRNAYEFPGAYYFQSVARVNLNDLTGAESSAREGIERGAGRRYPQVEGILGLVLAARGKLVESAEHLSKYLKLNPNGEDASEVRARLSEVNAQIAAHSLR